MELYKYYKYTNDPKNSQNPILARLSRFGRAGFPNIRISVFRVFQFFYPHSFAAKQEDLTVTDKDFDDPNHNSSRERSENGADPVRLNSIVHYNALVQRGYADDSVDYQALTDELQRQVDILKGGMDVTILAAQANTLNTIFCMLADEGARNAHYSPDRCLGYFQLAFKAQSQCRSTLEAIANIQNPPITKVAQQVNVGHNQQIINGKPPTELGDTDDLPENHKAQGIEQKDGSQAQALGEIDRAKVVAGEG